MATISKRNVKPNQNVSENPKIDIQNLNPETLKDADLESWAKKFMEEVSKRKENKEKSAKDKILKIAQDAGINVYFEDTIPNVSPNKHPPKYKNPDNQNETWSGLGRKPEWFKKLESENRISEAEIKE